MMALEKHAATASHWSEAQYQTVFASSGPRRVALVIEEDARIENVAVAGPSRRRGLGTRLLGEFLDLARREGADAVFLEVRESNRAARRLYEQWAFEESGQRNRYYRNPEEDALVYRLCFG